MRLESLGPNQTKVYVQGKEILFSYSTPVAAYIDNQWHVTTEFHSRVTNKHIKSWVGGRIVEKPQEFFDNLVAAI